MGGPLCFELHARGGDEAAGFEIGVDRARRVLRVRSWGLWTLGLGNEYRDAMFLAFEGLRGRPWALLSDRRGSMPQREDVQAVIAKVMERATVLGRRRAAVVVSSAVEGLQMRRLASETHVHQRQFAEEEAAVAWLVDPE